jgi:hypothetical protein
MIMMMMMIIIIMMMKIYDNDDKYDNFMKCSCDGDARCVSLCENISLDENITYNRSKLLP